MDTCDNEFLTAPFLEDEIKEAIWSCNSDKSPGPDGFSFNFIKSKWNLLKSKIGQMMADFHQFGRNVKGMNPSFIVLIPKKECGSSLDDYRPISLIGCLFKIISKILACRISKVLESVISETQSAFIGGRQISDGIVVLNEVLDESKKRRKSWVVFKVDFAKAYDSVSWEFLDDMMQGLNFCPKWRAWIRKCVSSASASSSVLINGSPTGEFKLERGLRQGDPLSPFLYLIVAEGLSLLIEKEISTSQLEPIEVGRDRVQVSHLQYADDTIFVCPSKMENIRAHV